MWKLVVRAHKAFGRNLLVANTVSSGGFLMIGDFLQQKREGKKFDWNRSFRMLAVGISQGPPHHYWYVKLDQFLPGTSRLTVVKKILADQIVAAPFFAITFIYGASLLEGKSLTECWREFCNKFPTIYMFDWLLWPPSQYINFSLIPGQYRVLYVNLVTVVWDVFLSYIKHKDHLDIDMNNDIIISGIGEKKVGDESPEDYDKQVSR